MSPQLGPTDDATGTAWTKGAERTLWEGLPGPLARSDFTFQKQMIFKNKGIYFTIEHKPKFRQKRKKEKKKDLYKPNTTTFYDSLFSVSLVYDFPFLYSYKQLQLQFYILTVSS